jgi:phytoene synthase
VCRDLAALALQHFDTAEAAMRRSSRRAMRPAAVMGAFYRAMLDALVEAGWRDPAARVSLSKSRKLWLVLRHGFV